MTARRSARASSKSYPTASGAILRWPSASSRSCRFLLLPMPRWLLDVSLALSITVAVMILMTVLFIRKPLEFSTYPTVLLITTLLRLSLNVASARIILAHGNEGPDAAGHVIQAFGQFVMSGNFIIGVIVFGILLVVNFVVITKGSTRIAEVAARFSLDAMPGKQMAIDADMNAGLIDEAGARKTPQGAGRGKHLLRRHGRRLEIRARRCDRGPDHHGGQYHRRHHHRHAANGPILCAGDAFLYAADRRRRPGDAGAGADGFSIGRSVWCPRRASAVRPTRRCSVSSAITRRRSASAPSCCSAWVSCQACRSFLSCCCRCLTGTAAFYMSKNNKKIADAEATAAAGPVVPVGETSRLRPRLPSITSASNLATDC